MVKKMIETVPNWLYRQIERLAGTRNDLIAPALLRAMKEDERFRWAVVVGAYLDEQINLGKAAELLGMHRVELQRQFMEKGIPIRIGSQTFEEVQAEVEAWSAWMQKNE